MARLIARFLALSSLVVAVPATPAAAALDNAGAVVLAGTVSYDTPNSVPVLSGCQATGFTMSMAGAIADVELLGSEYAGPVSLDGYGVSICMSYADGGTGGMTYTLSGSGPLGELQCSIYTSLAAFGPLWTWYGDGSCTVADQSVSDVWVTGQTQAVPAGVSTGGYISSLALTGTLAICASGNTICPIPEIA